MARQPRCGPATALLPALLSVAAGCGRASPPRESLELVQFSQSGAQDVWLDETLVFRFSRDLDRSSVTRQSVRIHIAGEPELSARGSFRIHRERLDFVPELARESDLTDGGLLPGREYVVELAGFPRPDGLRSEGGGPLSATLRLPFRTASPPAQLFESRDPRGSLRLEAAQRGPSGKIEIGPLAPIVLVVEEPVDPRSLVVGEFQILPAGGDPATDVVPLVPRLAVNAAREARIELFPVGEPAGTGGLRALEVGTYYLSRDGERQELRGLGGGVLAFGRQPQTLVEIQVMAPRVETETIVFDGGERPWYGEPFGFDGTAHWPRSEGGVTLRYPAAAGDGRDGSLDPFSGLAGRTDLAATELRVPQGETVDLSETHGFVVLRSQGAIEIDGTLKREITGPWTSSLVAEFDGERNVDPSDWETLSAWLERARRLNEPWTVLVAGGDLRVTGNVQVEGPLLLVAGGWLRVYGRVEADHVFKSPEGGGSIGRVVDAPLVLDPPETNLLRRPLRVGILTNTRRPLRGVEAWRGAVPVIEPGAGRAEVRFLGLRDRESRGVPDRFDPVRNVRLLDGCQALRLLLVLEMPPGEGEPWSPPRIESVELSWDTPRQAPL